jgi:RNA polymerase sigma-70 factor (ECF subfamily)
MAVPATVAMSTQNAPDHAVDPLVIERCRQKDFEAFGKLVDAYQNRVFGFVKRMVPDPEEAADITQEVFIRAFQAFERFDGRCSVRTWLFRIAYNLCVDRSRKVERGLKESPLSYGEDEESMEISDERWQPEQLLITQELMEVVEAAIASMSEKLRSVLLLHDREDMAYDEIAESLDIPVGTVKSRLFLARNHLQNALRPYVMGGEPHV